MQHSRLAGATLPLVLGALAACAEVPTAPDGAIDGPAEVTFQTQRPGTGIVLDNLTGVTLPVIGLPVGDVIVDQAIITDLKVIEDVAGTLVGVEAEGILRLTGGVLGTDVVTEDFSTIVGVTSTGFGRCDVVTIDLGPIAVDALGPVAEVDVPATEVSARSSGAVGSLLCALGQLLGGLGSAVPGLVNAIDNLI